MKSLLFAAKVVVTLGLLLAVFANIDIAELGAVLGQADPALLIVATIFYASTFVVGGVRWRVVNAQFDCETTLAFCVRVFFISGFLSQIVLGGGYGGDVYRIWALARETGQELKALLTVLVDRVSGLMGAVLAVACLAPAYWLVFPSQDGVLLPISAAAVLTVALVAALVWAAGRGDTAGPTAKPAWLRRLLEQAHGLAEGIVDWRATALHLSLSLVALLLNMCALAAIGAAVGVEIGAKAYLLLGPIVFLAKSFPLSVAGWGTREAAMIYFFGFAGVDAESALSMSLLAGVLVLAASTPGGVLWFRRPAAIRAQANAD